MNHPKTSKRIKKLVQTICKRYAKKGFGSRIFAIRQISLYCGVKPETVEQWYYGLRKPRGGSEKLVNHLEQTYGIVSLEN